MLRPRVSSPALRALLVGLGVFLAFNANGREIGTYDSQPTKYAARQLALRGTLALDEIVTLLPPLKERPGFVLARDGHWRTRYPLAPVLPAAAMGAVLHRIGVVNLEVLYSSNIVAKLTASALVALAVVFAFLCARRYVGDGLAALVALGLGLGTGLWPTASQTLWQVDSVVASLAGATLLLHSRWRNDRLRSFAIGALLGFALTSRMQVLPAVVVLFTYCVTRKDLSVRWVLMPLVACIAAMMWGNVIWLGNPIGGATAMEQLHPLVHATQGSLNHRPWEGLAGLLVSPNRGLIVFSPIVLITLPGAAGAWRSRQTTAAFACLLAGVVQIVAYSFYSVWWGGHTYGPRYLLDVLPLLVPAGALGAAVAAQRPSTSAAALVFTAASVAIAAVGAFGYPAERWNNDPLEIDTHHERLWDWRDLQIVRCWQTGQSPQNYAFFDRSKWGRQ
jgi:hypothetical protein